MRVIVPHHKTLAEVRASIDQGFDRIFTGMPLGSIQIADQQRSWTGDTLNFAFNAKAGFFDIPVKGTVKLEETQVIIDLDLPGFVSQFVADSKIQAAVESQVRGLL